jgi:hypothetical protein
MVKVCPHSNGITIRYSTETHLVKGTPGIYFCERSDDTQWFLKRKPLIEFLVIDNALLHALAITEALHWFHAVLCPPIATHAIFKLHKILSNLLPCSSPYKHSLLNTVWAFTSTNSSTNTCRVKQKRILLDKMTVDSGRLEYHAASLGDFRRFEGYFRLHLQEFKPNSSRTLNAWRPRRYGPSKRWKPVTQRHSVTARKAGVIRHKHEHPKLRKLTVAQIFKDSPTFYGMRTLYRVYKNAPLGSKLGQLNPVYSSVCFFLYDKF